jgi:hypothetical protein
VVDRVKTFMSFLHVLDLILRGEIGKKALEMDVYRTNGERIRLEIKPKQVRGHRAKVLYFRRP